MQDKNFIIFTVLTIVVILIWINFLAPKPKPRKTDDQIYSGSTVDRTQPGQPAALPGSTLPAALSGSSLPPSMAPPSQPHDIPGSTAPAVTAVPPSKKIAVSTDVFEVEFSDLGAAPIHWRLTQYPREKCYKYRVDIAWPPLTTNPPCDTTPVDLAESVAGNKNYSLMAQVSVDGEKIPVNASWEVETVGDVELTDADSVGEVVFKTPLADGRVVKKTYTFRKSRYDVGLDFTVEGGNSPKRAGADIALFYTWNPYGKKNVPSWNFNGPETHDGTALNKIKPKDVVKGEAVSVDAVDWAGFSYDYFLVAVLSSENSRMNFATKYIGKDEDKKNKQAAKELVGWVRLTATDEEMERGEIATAILFMGPKEKSILSPVRGSLRYSIDYGMLKILVLPLIEGLVWINRLFHNYGVSIIILTVILRMAMFPLTRKSQKSMKDMQKLQPEIQKLREKYPDDRAKQNEEMQAVWRKHKINPAMGCLPILLQFPVFFAFYKALLISIELRQAPFLWWIIDLGERDPLYIWPVMMGATQLITQKMTPTQMDPMQQKIFLLMPIVFMYILRDFPAGLLIYWTVQNLVGIAQQVYVNRQPD